MHDNNVLPQLFLYVPIFAIFCHIFDPRWMTGIATLHSKTINPWLAALHDCADVGHLFAVSRAAQAHRLLAR